MNRWHPTLAIAAGALVLLTAAGGGFSPGASQAPARPQAPQVPPAFRLSTTMVEVDATVVDGSGKFVDSLGIDDFEILDEGAPRPVQVLYLVDGPVVKALAKPGGPTPAPPPEGAIPQPQATPLPDQVRLAMSQAPQRVLILFFDQDHLDQSSFNRVRQASERFLTTRFQDGDLGGVLMGTTMVGNRLTKDRQELLSAVQSAKLNPGQSLIRNELRDYPRMTQIEAVRIALSNDSRVLDQVTDRAAREGGGAGGRGGPDLRPLVMEKARNVVVQLQQSTVSTLKAMQGLLNGLARVPGRKSVLFITEGFLFEQSWADLRVLVGQAARANVRIYTIDALGLRRGERETDLSMMTPVETGSQVPLEAYNTVEEGPNTLAVDTGGYVIRKTNDFAGAMAEIAGAAGRYYVLGFSPEDSALTGKFRQITVRVKREGVQVRARKGYVAALPRDATAAAPAATPGRPAEPAAEAAAKPAPVAVAPPAAGKARAELAPPLPAAALPLRPDTASRVRELESRAGGSGEVKSLATQGWERYSRGDLEGAEALLSKAAAQPEAPPWVFYALGFAQLGMGKADLASQSWEHVRTAVPAFSQVYFDLADAYLQLDSTARAVDILRAAEQRWPKDTDVLNALGTVQVRRGSNEDAIATFERAISLAPKESLAYLNAARTYELRYYQLRRFSRPQAHWLDNPDLLSKAIGYYETYLKLGGTYGADAQAALDRLRNIR